MKTGIGYDIHRLEEGESFILGGLEIKSSRGLKGHSDADVAVHALADALLGAGGMGDIGTHFPDSDDSYKNISSIILLKKVRDMLEEKNYGVNNIDMTIVCQSPPLSPHCSKMKKNIASALCMPEEDINIKATTKEGLGAEGKGEAVSVIAVATIIPAPDFSR